MTIQEATQHFQVSEKTIRRWIKRGKLSAELIDGRWHVQADGQNDQTPDKAALIGQLQAENAHLRDQLTEKDNQLIRRDEQTDHLQQLLAVSQKSIGQLTEQNQLLAQTATPALPFLSQFQLCYIVSLVKGFCPVPVRVYAHFGHGFRTSQNTSVAHGQNPIRHR